MNDWIDYAKDYRIPCPSRASLSDPPLTSNPPGAFTACSPGEVLNGTR